MKKRIFLIVIFCILMLEICLQVCGAFIGYKNKRIYLSGGTFDILCIGDSFTYGVGAEKDQSYPSFLGIILNRAYPGNNFRVVNLGNPGYNSSQCLNLLKEACNTYKPRLVLVMTGMNNCWNWVESSYFKIKQSKYEHPLRYRMAMLDAGLSRIKIYKLIKIYFFNLTNKNKLAPAFPETVLNKYFPPPERSAEFFAVLTKGSQYYVEGKYTEAEPYFLKAMTLSPQDYEPHWFMGRLYRILYSDEKRCDEELLLALKYVNNPILTMDILSEIGDQEPNSYTHAKLVKIIKEMRPIWINKFGLDYVRQLIDPTITSEDRIRRDVLNYDLKEMNDFIQARGGKLVILTYPLSIEGFRLPANIYASISKKLKVPLIDNAEAFRKYLTENSFEYLFVADGHCTGAGYKLLAENVFSGLKKYGLLLKN